MIDETKLAIADSAESRLVMDAIALCRDRAVADVVELEEDDDGPLPEPSTSRLSAFQKDFAELVAAFAAFDDELVGKLVRVRAIRGKEVAEQVYDQMYTAVGLLLRGQKACKEHPDLPRSTESPPEPLKSKTADLSARRHQGVDVRPG